MASRSARVGGFPAGSVRFLFVYGTLRPCANTPMARWLRGAAEHVGPGDLRGRLYELGAYPGFVDGSGRGEWVSGDVYRLPSCAGVLGVLDRYEGGGGARERAEYARVERIVHVNGRRRGAWVYLYVGPLLGRKWIRSGDYARRACEP